jgi:hypothetical protein
MTKPWKSRKPVVGICAVLVTGLVVGAGEISSASSLSLPLETPTVPVKTPAVPVQIPTVPVKAPTVTVPAVPVKVPTVTVKTPAVPVKVPAVPVKVPTVTVKTPAVTVKTPAVTVKVPTVTVKTPTVPVKVSVPVKTTATKTPSVPAKSPPVSIKTPTVPVKTPTVEVRTPDGLVRTVAGSVSAPSVSAKVRSASGGAPSVTTSLASRHGATGTTAAASSSKSASGYGGGGSGTSSSPIGAYVGPGVGYSKLPPIEGSLSHRARASIVHRERKLKAMVAQFHGCLAALASTQRELLELRTGYGDKSPLSPRATARRLHLDPAQIGGLEKQAVRELHAAAKTNSCARTGELVNGVFAFIGSTFGDGQASATGGVKAVRYVSPAPTHPSSPAPSTLGRILGTNIGPTASDVLLVLLVLMGLGAIVAVVLADAAGQGPRHEAWRQRVINLMRSLR